MSEVWSLPGYDVQALIGFGATGEVWRAREVATGDTVALKRLREGADPPAVEALRREAALLRSLDTPYVVRLRAVVGEGARAVLVLDHAAGGSLGTLLTRRGSLSPGEVVTVAAPLAQALAAAHERGLVHGDVSPANVLFTAEGMPLLADLGVARTAGERRGSVDGTAEYVDPAVAAGGEPGAAADVWALAAVCHHMLAGTPPHDGDDVEHVLDAAAAGARAPLGLLAPSAPRALVHAVEQGLATDPAQRPDASAFASLLSRAHAAAPVRLSGAPAAAATLAQVRPTHTVRTAPVVLTPRSHRRPGRSVLLPGTLGALVLLAGAVGWLSGRGSGAAPVSAALPPAVSASTPAAASSGSAPAAAASPPAPGLAAPRPPPAPPAPPPAPVPDFAALLDGLDAARAEAFRRGDVGALGAVYAPGSAGLAADSRLLQQLADAGHSAHGLRHTVRSVQVEDADAGSARLRVVDVLAAYEVRDAQGAVVRRSPARGEAPYVVELTRTASGWRLVRVTAG